MSITRQLRRAQEREQRKAERRQMKQQQPATGPRTEAGKRVSSQNAVRHGLTCSRFRMTMGESEQEYQALLESLHQEHRPQTITESILVERMAQSWWLTQRAIACGSDPSTTERQLSLFIRYQTTHDRAFHAALKQLKALQAERKAEERGEPELKLRDKQAKVALSELRLERSRLTSGRKPDSAAVPLGTAA